MLTYRPLLMVCCVVMAVVWASVFGAARVMAQDQTPKSSVGTRHLVVMAGLTGDGDYRERMTTAVQQIATAAPSRLSIDSKNMHGFLSDEAMVEQLKSELPSSVVCSTQRLREFFAEASQQWKPEDSLWIVMIGHTETIENRCFFHVQGRDFVAEDLATWLKPLPCHQQVTFLTMPASGTWLSALKAPGRINIAATDSAGESTGTEFPYALGNILAGKQSTQALEDIDKDGQLSLLDLYLSVALEVHALYKAMERLPTEHAQLDDNGDGRGREIQEPLIPVEEDEGEPAEPKSTPASLVITSNSDGAAARAVFVR